MDQLTLQEYINKKQKESFLKTMKLRYKELSYLLCKISKANLQVEVLFLLFTLLQLLSFCLAPHFAPVWKCNKNVENFLYIMEYFQIIPFFYNNKSLYFVMFYILIAWIIIQVTWFVILLTITQTQKSPVIRVYYKLLNHIFIPFYLPITLFLLSITSCKDGTNYYVSSISCWSGWHFLHSFLGYAGVIVNFFISYWATTSLYTMNLFKINDITPKTTAKSDVKFLFVKTWIAILHIYSHYNLSSALEWFIAIFYLFVSLYIYYEFNHTRAYVNTTIMQLYRFIFCVWIWCNLSLLISKCLVYSTFDGGIFIFFKGLLILIVIFYFMDKDAINQDILDMNNEYEIIRNITIWIQAIGKLKQDRSAQLLIYGYVNIYEKNCTQENCPLKSYLNKTDSADDNVIYLYQHVENLFLNAMEQFHNSVQWKINFCLFLLNVLNKKNYVLSELLTLETANLSMEEEFFIYKYIRYIENHDDIDKTNKENTIIQGMIFKKESNLFKQWIKKVSLLYMDFWNILLISNQDNKESLERLNNIGKNIRTGNKEIQDSFEILQNIKNNDKSILFLYSDFLWNVVNNKDKAVEFKNKWMEIESEELNDNSLNSTTSENWDILNSSALSTNDVNQYIILSSQTENFGIIMNMSLSLCSLLGYTKNDLIGRNYDKIIPKLYLKEHNDVLLKRANETKHSLMISKENKNNGHIGDIQTFLMNRSKYLIPIKFKVAIIPNEFNDCFFIAKAVETKAHNDSYVWVSKDLIIQHFTVNAIHQLGWSNDLINCGKLISDYIKEFQEKFLKIYSDYTNKSLSKSLQIKHTIQNEIFWNKENIITWKINEKKQNQYNNEYNKFKLEVLEQVINGVVVGYIYKFTAMKVVETQNCSDREKGSNKALGGVTFSPYYSTDWANAEMNVNNQGNKESQANQAKIDLIGKDFIPSDFSKFNWDPEKMSFLKDNTSTNPEESKSALKTMAMQKMKNFGAANTSKDQSIHETSEEYSESYSRDASSKSGESDYNSNSNDNSEVSSKEKDKFKLLNNNNDNNMSDNEDCYYKINFSNIKYSVYDFKKNIIIEIKDYDRISEIEIKKFGGEKEKDQTKRKQTFENSAVAETGVKEGVKEGEGIFEINRKDIIMKQIENALAREETQPTIVRLKQASYLTILLWIGIGASFLAVFNQYFSYLIENVWIIQKGHDWMATLLYGFYYVREWNWYNHGNYTNKPNEEDLTQAFQDIQTIWLDYFNITNERLNYIYTTFTPFSKNISAWMTKENVNCYVMRNVSDPIDENGDAQPLPPWEKYVTIQYNLTLSAAFTELNNALFHIAISPHNEIIPTNKNVYFYSYNSLNPIYINLQTQNQYFVDTINQNINTFSNITIILFVGTFLIWAGIFQMLTYTYKQVAIKKESYWEVFFDIEKSVLQMFLESLDFFNMKIQADKSSESNSFGNMRGNRGIFDKKSINDDKDSFDDENERNALVNNFVFKEQRHRRKNTNKLSKETQLIKYRIWFALLLVYVFIIVMFVLLIQYLADLRDRVVVFSAFYELYTTYIRFYCTWRAYIFDSNSTILNRWTSSFVTYTVPTIYDNISDKKAQVTNNISKYPQSFISLYKAINEGNICNYGDEKIFSQEVYSCDTFWYGSANFGLEHMLSSYIIEIIAVKNLNLRTEVFKDELFNYNLTLLGTDYQDYSLALKPEEEENYYEFHQINTWSDKRIVEINYFLLYYWIPCFEELNSNMKDNWNNIIKSKDNLFFWWSIVFMIINLAWFISLFIPFVNSLDQIIYKTKNMLIIIPKQVLCNIPNIFSILNITDSSWTNDQAHNNNGGNNNLLKQISSYEGKAANTGGNNDSQSNVNVNDVKTPK